ncbi:MFS transporter [Brevibacillus antibioticus]|uniref:MFS transporter n=1 Tax=Brevibacillus antibioticus TaxID=2570228 RepID=A0A4U2YCF9_9BACL|nr:MFS transporter [Brevibacillus antibioticus]TKI57091.1 MFS transporter [Brevibacillus antibioticus]
MKDIKSFRLLWIGQSFANFGDILYIVGLIAVIHSLNGSTFQMAMVPFITMISRFLGALIAPLLFERYSLKSLISFSQIGKTWFILLLALFIIADMHNTSTLIVLLLMTSLIGFFDGWASPARDSLIPRLVHEDKLIKYNSFLSIVDRTIQLGGWPISSILLVWLGSSTIFWLTFGLYVLSSIMMVLIRRMANETEPTDISTDDGKRFKGAKEGFKYIFRTPTIRTLTIAELLDSIANVVWIAAIIYVFIEDALRSGEEWWGYLNSLFFAGLLLGGMLGFKYEDRIQRNLVIIVRIGAVISSGLILLFAQLTNPWIAVTVSFLFGLFSQLKGVSHGTLVQISTPESVLPKVYSAQDALNFALYGVATMLFGYLTDQLGVRFVFNLSGGLLLVGAGILMFGSLSKVGLLQNNEDTNFKS